MTDRVNRIEVALEKDIREDDIEPLLTAIRQMRGVLSVATNVADSDAWIAEERASAAWRAKLLKVIFPEDAG